jgi:hypothetical protein
MTKTTLSTISAFVGIGSLKSGMWTFDYSFLEKPKY